MIHVLSFYVKLEIVGDSLLHVFQPELAVADVHAVHSCFRVTCQFKCVQMYQPHEFVVRETFSLVARISYNQQSYLNIHATIDK